MHFTFYVLRHTTKNHSDNTHRLLFTLSCRYLVRVLIHSKHLNYICTGFLLLLCATNVCLSAFPFPFDSLSHCCSVLARPHRCRVCFVPAGLSESHNFLVAIAGCSTERQVLQLGGRMSDRHDHHRIPKTANNCECVFLVVIFLSLL